ncbi:MAG: tetratricopeptide repeat protein [Pirellulales bacterium]|nr:tetratricopeptide repeat protein [Pirellulales bacterium]
MHTPHFQRGAILLQQHRHDLAEQEFRQALVDDPHSELAHAMLALCLRQLDRSAEGVEEARAAIGLDPELALGHFALALNLLDQKQRPAALAASREAVRLDPHDADHHSVEALVHLSGDNYQESLAAAERGLACDPKHTRCQNLRALALRQLGRADEALAASEEVLAESPENSLAHTVRAWAFLEQGNVPQALVHFSEALRLDPNDEFARQGMIEALKSRYRVYRWFFAFRLWMARLGSRLQWVFIIGLLVFMRVASAAGRANPALKRPAQIVVGLYLLFVFFSWTGEPLSDFLLRLNRFGRQALNRYETWTANAVGGCLLLAIASALVGCVSATLRYPGLAGGVVFLTLIIPVAGMFSRRSGWPQWTMGGVTTLIALLACASLGLSLLFIAGGEQEAGDGAALIAGLIAVIGSAASTWIGLATPKRD